MYKKKSFFITFEGIEGSGKSYQSKKLFKKIKSMKLPVLYTREPGGTFAAEKIRQLILDDYYYPGFKEKFDKYTDTLLYMASRNEHIKKKIYPSILKKKIIICDRFTDSTLAYQVYGKGVSRNLVNNIHRYILGQVKPDLTFILKTKVSKAMLRLKKRKKKNRYDRFTEKFYNKVQKAFLRIAKSNKRKYMVVDNSFDIPRTEEIIYKKFIKTYSK
ncbi:MAG: dTMP kinase [Acidiferrobacteraceae bacterium]|jgi:dTMP kinase|nr:dTMP kinase [Acidiferrobacteraceae bacterium]|tara:strand:- start:2013 stop:2660 length:648 start_codon:yes stop_codon:yes gene_type:complete